MSFMSTTQSIQDIRIQFSEFLGLYEPVSEEVVRAALDDPLYAHHLVTCRNTPEFLQVLLAEPPDVALLPTDEPREHSTAKLVARAAKALWKWSKTGFAIVDEATYRTRLIACQSCHNFIDPPDNSLYRIAGSAVEPSDNKICRLCGCVISKKAKLLSESCPDIDQNNPDHTRWGEPPE